MARATENARVLTYLNGACRYYEGHIVSFLTDKFHASGVYTTAFVSEDDKIVDHNLHIQRLVKSIRALHKYDQSQFDAYVHRMEVCEGFCASVCCGCLIVKL